ncbi:hypothetical protein VE03_03670 [Pseudogymnoascus sp. 23342-1-I1]|nr:hypothetical protein VE03_03583 [Pseudogymnoascus sp. 23342-1-I1]OBT66577.1 hypothetical protein VE03_03670 [Pseudogymnoascus sp. 23342-1-I1]
MEGSASSAGGAGGGGTGQRTSCDSCKRSKLKCIKPPGNDKCTRCTARNTECQVTLVSRKKREKKIHYLSAIEDRMKRMESAMNASGIAIDGDPEAAIPAVSAQSALEDKLSIFMISDDGAAGFVGPSSGFSLFSPQGLRWISEKTGNNDFEQVINEVSNTCEQPTGDQATFRPLRENEREPLPPKDVANEYMAAYFDNFNNSFPLYDKESVMERFAKDYYMVNREKDPAWYASLNVIFLIGRSIAMHEREPHGLCEKYFRNASSVFSELLFNGPSLLAVQAMVGMALVLQASEDPHPSYMLVGMAARLAQAIGLHRRLDGYGLKERDIEQRRNVFWIVFGLEKGISIRSGRPSVFSDDDIGVELPPKTTHAYKDLSSADSVLGSYRCVATIALLESRVYTKLYSARSHTKSDLERLKWVGSLDRELQQWRDELPIEIRPEKPIKCHSKHLMDVIMIHFAYYNCLVAIHRGSSHHGSWIYSDKPTTVRDAKNIGLSPRVFESSTICLTAARQIIGLLHYYDTTEHSDVHNLGIVTMCNYYPLTASLTLFANLLQNPTAPTATTDLALMNRVTCILVDSFASSCNPKAALHVDIFRQIIRTAAQFVARARGEPPDTYLDPSTLPPPPIDCYYSPAATSSGVSPSASGTDASGSDPLPRLEPSISHASQQTSLPPFSTPSPATPASQSTTNLPAPQRTPSQQQLQAQLDYYGPKQGLAGTPGAGIIPPAYDPDYTSTIPSVDLSGFDFNNYAWQDSGAFPAGPGVEAAGGAGGVEVETFAAGGIDGGGGVVGYGSGATGGFADETGFAPMVFQWDLADIWQGGGGFAK